MNLITPNDNIEISCMTCGFVLPPGVYKHVCSQKIFFEDCISISGSGWEMIADENTGKWSFWTLAGYHDKRQFDSPIECWREAKLTMANRHGALSATELQPSELSDASGK